MIEKEGIKERKIIMEEESSERLAKLLVPLYLVMLLSFIAICSTTYHEKSKGNYIFSEVKKQFKASLIPPVFESKRLYKKTVGEFFLALNKVFNSFLPQGLKMKKTGEWWQARIPYSIFFTVEEGGLSSAARELLRQYFLLQKQYASDIETDLRIVLNYDPAFTVENHRRLEHLITFLNEESPEKGTQSLGWHFSEKQELLLMVKIRAASKGK